MEPSELRSPPDTPVEAVEDALADLWDADYGPGVLAEVAPDLTWGISGAPAPFLNFAARVRLPGVEADARLAALSARFEARRVPFGFYVTPLSRPADLPDRLERLGLSLISTAPGRAVSLEGGLREPPVVPGLEVRRVLGAAALAQWARVLPEATGAAFLEPAMASLNARAVEREDSPWRLYVGRLGGKAVGTSSVFLGPRVVGVYTVSVLPSARGRGVGAALTAAPLLEAARDGHRVAALLSSPLGLPVYERLGFEVACEVRLYGRAVA